MAREQPPEIRLVIDNRERALLDMLKQLKVTYTVESMPLADIAILARRNSQTWTTIGLFERKTWEDLRSSLIDGRYNEQKTRLMHYSASNPQAQVGYLIEGGIPPKPPLRVAPMKNIQPEVLRKLELSMQFLDCLAVLRTSNLKDTVLTLKILMKYLHQTKWRTDTCYAPPPREAPPPALSKAQVNSSKHSIFLRQMMCVPGVSYETAKLLTSKFPNASKLRDTLKVKGEIAKMKRTTGKRTKLGPKLELSLKDVFV